MAFFRENDLVSIHFRPVGIAFRPFSPFYLGQKLESQSLKRMAIRY